MLGIINAKIETLEDKTYEAGTILIENGIITYVGENIPLPDNADIIDAKGRLVLPGFIDAHSHLGMWEEGIGFEGADGNEYTDPVTPHLRAVDGINPMDEAFKTAYEHGVTATSTGPGSTNVIGGQFAVIKTFGKAIDKMIIKAPAAMKCAFGENPKRYFGETGKAPVTRMDIAAKLRETLKQAIDYKERLDFAGEDISKRPKYDPKLEALIPVIERKIPLKAHVHRADDILTAIRIAKEFNLKLTLDHCTEGHLIADEIKESGFNAIVGPSFGFKTKYEIKNKTFETLGVLADAGVKTAIMTDHPVFSLSDLPLFAALAVKAGMEKTEAMKAITVNAAEILGVEDRIGSIKVGKDADLVIWDIHPFDINCQVAYTIVSGQIVYEKR